MDEQARKVELLPIRKVELLPEWGTQGGTAVDLSGEIGAPNFVPLPIFDSQLGARGIPALPGGTTVDNPGENGIIVGRDTEGAGETIDKLLKQSQCSFEDFYKYLNKINSNYADTFVKT